MAAFPPRRAEVAALFAAAFVVWQDLLVHVLPKAFTVFPNGFLPMDVLRRLEVDFLLRPMDDDFFVMSYFLFNEKMITIFSEMVS